MEQNLSDQTLNPNSLSNRQNDVAGDEDDDDAPTLSLQALEALKEFLAEQSHPLPDADADAAAESRAADSTAPTLISEDWRLSQFWYDPHTAQTLAREVLTLRDSFPNSATARVACVACPSLYAYLKNVVSEVSVQLLEYDKRFGQYGSDFTYYDYNRPEDLPLELKHAFDIVVADPPYLSQECLEKVAQTVLFLARSEKSYVLLLTGSVQKERAAELMGLQPCGFRPQHSSKLGNEFRLFTNYDPKMRLEGWEAEK